jgi:exodeoxyribonuclease VII large subunit
VADAPLRLRQIARRQLARASENFDSLAGRLSRLHPRRRLDESIQRLDDLQSGLLRGLKSGVRGRAVSLENLSGRFLRVRPAQLLKRRREALRQLEHQLNLLGPEQVLSRGYSITTDAASGKVLRDATKIQSGQKINTRLKAGEIVSEVQKTSK